VAPTVSRPVVNQFITKAGYRATGLSIANAITREVQVPLNNLTAIDLRDRATELSRMAGTATTADTRDALHRLASRFAELAQQRSATGGQAEPSASVSAWQPPSPNPSVPPSQPPPS